MATRSFGKRSAVDVAKRAMDGDYRQGVEKRQPACDAAVEMGEPARPLPHRPVRDVQPAQRFFTKTGLAGEIRRGPPEETRGQGGRRG